VFAAIVLPTWVSASEVIANAATAAAVFIGGLWAYRRFFRERTRWPRADLTLTVTQRRLDPRTILANVKVTIRNDGRGLMELAKIRVDLHHVLPLESEMREKIDAYAHFQENGVEASWRLIKRHKQVWGSSPPIWPVRVFTKTPKRPELEPGESDTYGFDFFIPATTEAAFVYAYVGNLAKKGGKHELGWSLTEYFDINTPAPAGCWASMRRKANR